MNFSSIITEKIELMMLINSGGLQELSVTLQKTESQKILEAYNQYKSETSKSGSTSDRLVAEQKKAEEVKKTTYTSKQLGSTNFSKEVYQSPTTTTIKTYIVPQIIPQPKDEPTNTKTTIVNNNVEPEMIHTTDFFNELHANSDKVEYSYPVQSSSATPNFVTSVSTDEEPLTNYYQSPVLTKTTINPIQSDLFVLYRIIFDDNTQLLGTADNTKHTPIKFIPLDLSSLSISGKTMKLIQIEPVIDIGESNLLLKQVIIKYTTYITDLKKSVQLSSNAINGFELENKMIRLASVVLTDNVLKSKINEFPENSDLYVFVELTGVILANSLDDGTSYKANINPVKLGQNYKINLENKISIDTLQASSFTSTSLITDPIFCDIEQDEVCNEIINDNSAEQDASLIYYLILAFVIIILVVFIAIEKKIHDL